MSDAFKCDKCGEFEEGSPCRRKYRSYAGSGITGWTGATTKTTAELCQGCAEAADKYIAECLTGEQE